MLTLTMKVKACAVTDPTLISHGSVISLALRVGIRPRETYEVMILAEVDTIQLERSLEGADARNDH
jgi:hypothetical protein